MVQRRGSPLRLGFPMRVSSRDVPSGGGGGGGGGPAAAELVEELTVGALAAPPPDGEGWVPVGVAAAGSGSGRWVLARFRDCPDAGAAWGGVAIRGGGGGSGGGGGGSGGVVCGRGQAACPGGLWAGQH